MAQVQVRAYCSPTLVFLAFNWEEGAEHEDFLGFAIERSPGFGKDRRPGFLWNKVGFDPPTEKDRPKPSNVAPIQKFHWWDSGIETADRGQRFAYTVTPVLGTGKHDLRLETSAAGRVEVSIPRLVENGIGVYFNRAVVSAQSFTRQFGRNPSGKKLASAMEWLSNGLADAIPAFVEGGPKIEGAIYHLTDKRWVMPALVNEKPSGSLVYHLKPPPKRPRAGARSNGKGDEADLPAVDELAARVPQLSCSPRTKANIMHDKFLVRHEDGRPSAVLMGSANFTPEGLTSQANLVHTFASPELARLYAARQQLLAGDPSLAETRKASTGWSQPVRIGAATLRVFFAPERQRESIDAVVSAVKEARRSVVFCLFSPTDAPLLRALLTIGDEHKLMFGLLNSIQDPTKGKTSAAREDALQEPSAAAQVQVEVFHRSRKDRKIVAYDLFREGAAPRGWLPELSAVDTSPFATTGKAVQDPGGKGRRGPPAVHVHHKFIVVDAETERPVIYTGSANMSKNSVFSNDENLLEIRGAPELAQAYFAEFMRLYEHYRARALWDWARAGRTRRPIRDGGDTFVLKTTRDAWVRGAYVEGTNEYNIRRDLAAPPEREPGREFG